MEYEKYVRDINFTAKFTGCVTLLIYLIHDFRWVISPAFSKSRLQDCWRWDGVSAYYDAL